MAKILDIIDWATGDRIVYSPDKMLKLYEKTGTIPMSESDVGKRNLKVDTQHSETEGDMSNNGTMSVLQPTANIFRRADVSTLGMKPYKGLVLGRLN